LALGLTAGFYGRWVDAVVMRVADVTLAFPSLLLLIAVAAAVRPSLPAVRVVNGLEGWAGLARRVRAQGLVWRGLDHVHAARALARPARPVPRAARRGVPVDRGHRLPEQRQHRAYPGAHAPRPGRIHCEADGPAPAPGPRAPGWTAGGAARRGPAPQCRARRD